MTSSMMILKLKLKQKMTTLTISIQIHTLIVTAIYLIINDSGEAKKISYLPSTQFCRERSFLKKHSLYKY